MSHMQLYNTKTKKLEEFKPRESTVSIYACGPTVYNYVHIGNLRTYISEDLLVRTLKLKYPVKHVMNITDVGHLTSDEDDGDDKMEEGAKREGLSIWDIAKRYTNAFKENIQELNINPPTLWINATDTIPNQIDLILKLEKLGLTYKISDGIYYDTSKFTNYGELSGQNLEELKKGARIAFNSEKKNISDFALWKFSKTKRQMEWESPWGIGFPGWHTECAAMALSVFGDHLDIHCGGIDHIKIHHTNEIAEVTPIINKKWVNFWFHCEFLLTNQDKMSKSSGKFLTLEYLKNEGIPPLSYRYYALLAHYRHKLNFSWEALNAAHKAFLNLKERISDLKQGDYNKDDLDKIVDDIKDIIYHDLNSPKLIAYLWSLLKDTTVSDALKFQAIPFFDNILGLNLKSNEQVVYNDEINDLLKKREDARKNKDFALSDILRSKIEALGYGLLDTAKGQVIKRK